MVNPPGAQLTVTAVADWLGLMVGSFFVSILSTLSYTDPVAAVADTVATTSSV